MHLHGTSEWLDRGTGSDRERKKEGGDRASVKVNYAVANEFKIEDFEFHHTERVLRCSQNAYRYANYLPVQSLLTNHVLGSSHCCAYASRERVSVCFLVRLFSFIQEDDFYH